MTGREQRFPAKLPHSEDEIGAPYLPTTKVYEGEPPRDPGASSTDHRAVTKEYDGPPPLDLLGTDEGRQSTGGYCSTTALFGDAAGQEPSAQSATTGRYQPATKTYGQGIVESSTKSNPTDDGGALDGPLGGTPYRALRKLGAGGMGEVFEAQDLEVGETVVVKVLRDLEAALVERMEREAEALARLRHPNIVQVSRYSHNASGHPYLAMERLYGRTLHEELKEKGAFAVDEAVNLVVQVLEGLAAAHEAGVLHRDIKLDNLFLCDAPNGGSRRMKIIDFGLTKDLPGAARRQLSYPTDVDMFVGTPRYAAPEQLKGTVDERADLYAVGLVLYSLFAGHEPFHDVRGMRDLLLANQNRSLEFRFARPIPARLERVLRRSVAKDPIERFSTALEFAEALKAALTGLPEVSVASGKSISIAIDIDDAAASDGSSAALVGGRRRGQTVYLIVVAIVSAGMFALLTAAAMHWLAR